MNRRDSRLLKPWINQLTRYRWQLVLGIALAAATGVLGLGLLSLSGWFITATALYLSINIYTPGAGIRFFAVGRTVSRYLERLLNHDLVLKAQARWRVAYFRQLQGQPLIELLNLRVSHSVQRLTRNLEAMDNLFLRLLSPLWAFAVVTLMLAILWLWLLPVLTISLLVAFAAVLFVSYWLAQRSRRLAVKQLRATTQLRNDTMQLTESAAELVAWGVYQEHQQQLLNTADKIEDTQLYQRCLQRRATRVVDGVGQLLLVVVIVSCLHSYSVNIISSAVAVMLVLSTMAWQELAAELPQQWSSYGNTLAAARDLQQQASCRRNDHVANEDNRLTRRDKVSVQIERLRIERQQRVLVDEWSETLASGHLYWLAGASGQGKSTLAEAVLGLYPITAGNISHSLGSQPLITLSSYLTQATEVFDATVLGNLNPQNDDYSCEDYWRVLRLVELDDTIKELPQQLDTMLGPQGVTLSGGELRRLALARVLLQDRPLMVLDEPFSGLDPALAGRVLQRILSSGADKTWLIISHTQVKQLLASPPLPVTTIRID